MLSDIFWNFKLKKDESGLKINWEVKEGRMFGFKARGEKSGHGDSKD